MEWKNRRVLITGGASFIGSHLADALVKRGARIRVVDNLSSGRLENIQAHVEKGDVEFIHADLLDSATAQESVAGIQTVFHLAADHGGRGYVDLHQAACATNLALDGIVFDACRKGGVEKVVYASSGCVYPNHLQTDPGETLYLTEDLVAPPYDADNLYGWAKLMGELTLKAYAEEWGLKSASCRYFTAFGPRGHENHAVIALIARSFLDQDPFIIWGNGEQIRNWTYVSDIVEGTILAAEKIEDGTAVNLGTMDRTSVRQAAAKILRHTKREHLTIQPDPTKPTGPMNRVADNSLARELTGWEPKVSFDQGVAITADWYYSEKDRDEVERSFRERLTER